MKAEHGRWAFVRLRLTCPDCGAVTVQRAPAEETPCAACATPIPVTDHPRIAAETGAPLDRLAWGATRTTPNLEIGRQQPLCWHCGTPTPLSAADLGAEHVIHCPRCDARTETWPAPEWLRLHLPDALQIYAAPAAEEAPDGEPIWMRCAACEAGMRIDADTPRLTRCGTCHARNHVPDAVWQALHPVRHGAPWFVLFEQISPAQRAARMQARTRLTEAIAAVGRADAPVQATIDVLKRDDTTAAEDALFEALRAPASAWFEAALAALAAQPQPRRLARLIEALEAEVDPARQLAMAQAIQPSQPAITRATCARLTDEAPSAVAAEALRIWCALDPAAALERAEALAQDAPLAVRRAAARLLIEHRRVPFGPLAAALLDHPESSVQRHAVRLITAPRERTAAAALRGLLGAGLTDAVTAALDGVGGRHAQAALAVARKAHGQQRIVATRWAAAAGAIPDLVALLDDLDHQADDAAQALCDALLAAPGAPRSAALCGLLDGPTLKIRLDAAHLLAEHGEAGALPTVDGLAGRWFTNRDLKRAAEAAATAIRWRIAHGRQGGLAVHEPGGLSEPR